MLEYFQGSAAIWVPDNLKSGVTTAHAYEPRGQSHVRRAGAPLRRGGDPGARRASQGQAQGRGERPDRPALDPGRAAPPDLLHARAISMPRFATRVDAINDRPMKAVGVSRRALFEQLDRPALRPLPATRYELAEWKPCRVNIDYHVEVAHNFYSVPYQLVHAQVETRATASDRRSLRARAGGSRRTCGSPGAASLRRSVAHMPRAHRAHAEWTPSRLIAWAEQTGPATGRFVAGILERRPHPEQGYRACLGLMRLGRDARGRPARGGVCAAPSGSAPIAIAPSSTFSPPSRIGSRSTSRPARPPADARERPRRHLLRGDVC